ncbi:MAG: hypothetical protein ABR962_07175 [Candidatus Bathyarchaeia archaeon]
MEKYHRNQKKLDKAAGILRQNPHGIKVAYFATKLHMARSSAYDIMETLDLQGKGYLERGTCYPKDSLERTHPWHGPEFDFRVEHSKELFASIFGKPGTIGANPYDDMLGWLIFSARIESNTGDRINENLSCLREHLRSYSDIDTKMKDVERIEDTLCSETIVCEPTNDKDYRPMTDSVESPSKECEELKIWLYWELRRLNDLVQHGTHLKGTCTRCPGGHATIKE